MLMVKLFVCKIAVKDVLPFPHYHVVDVWKELPDGILISVVALKCFVMNPDFAFLIELVDFCQQYHH